MIQFVENLNALGHWLSLHFGRISIEVAILAALVGAAIVALRIKRPAIRYAFWCLVLIKPAIALLATSPVSLYWYLQPEPEPAPIVMPAAPPLARPPMRPAGPAAPVMPPMRPPTVTPRPMPTPPPPPPEPTAWETFNVYGVGCAVWLAGVFVLFVRLVVGFAYVGFLRQSSRRQKVGLLAEAVADLRRELKIRRQARVAISYVAHGPVLAGIVRPTILIPNDLAEDLSQEQARLIVGHELAHVKRWDNLLLLVQRIIEVFFFFHPVIWLTGWLMRREAEAAADDKIISMAGRPADYADALARAAEVRIGLTRRMLVNTFAASESDHARRVRRILNGRVVKTSLAMGVVAVVALIIIAIVGLPGPSERKPDKEKGTAMSKKEDESKFEYGFRYDPMKWLASETSLDAALARTLLFDRARPDDARIIETHVKEVFATQRDDGSFEDEHGLPPLEATSVKLRELLRKGCSPDRPEMQRAIAFVETALRQLPESDWPKLPGDAVHVMCLLGKTGHPAIKVRLEALAEEMPDLWGKGCPGTPFAQLLDLWVGREVADVDGAIESTLAWADEAIAEPGCSRTLALCSSWSMIEVLGEIDHPIVTRLARRLAPMLLRSQQPDGQWQEGHGGNKTFVVLRMLAAHGLLEKLRERPPLPSDWKIVRALPARGERPMNVCALGGRMWVLDMAGPAIIEISPDDGRELGRLAIEPIPGLHHMTLAAGDGVFYVSAFGEKDVRTDTVHEVDAATGKSIRQFPVPATSDVTGATRVGRQIYACDGWQGGVWVIELDDPEAEPYQTYECVAAGMPDYMASDGETIWAVGFMAPSLVKSTPDGQMLDWGERPFGFQPVAWDGENLWALDPANSRICLIEKADQVQEADTAEWKSAEPAPYIRDWLICGPLPSEPLPDEEQLRAGHDTDYLEDVGGEAAAEPTEGQAIARSGWSAQWQQVTFIEESIMFAQVFGEGNVKDHVVYAYTTIDSPAAMDAYLAMGVAGSLKVYLNGQLVHDEHLARFAPRETILISVRFAQGANRVLVKVDNDIADGGFILRAIQLDPVTLERLPLTADLTSSPTPTGRTAAELAAGVKREGDKVWIEGVPDGTFGISWDMLARAMQTLLEYRGEKADFDELLAYSGDAFNLCHGSNWQGVSYLCAPTDIVGNMAEAYGYEYEPIHNGYPFETMADLERPARLEITERTLDRIRAEIEAGRPPLVGGAEGHCGSWTLAVGYDREGPLLCHVGDHEPYRWTPIRGVAAGSADEDFGHWNGRFRGTIRDGFVGGWQDNPAYLIKQKKAQTPTRRKNVLAALARAVQLHRAPTTHIGWWGGVDYHFGRRAYEQWAAELHKLDFPPDVEKPLPDEAYDWYEMGNMDIQADQIVRGRSAAATFCEKAVEVLPNAKEHLLAAAAVYREEAAIAKKAFAVFLDGTDEQREAWLSDEAKREAGVTAIAQMLEKDQLAIRHIRAALAAASVAVAAPVARPSEYGFRVDPMTWVENAESLGAALVRRDVFGTATEADDALIAAEIERLLAETAADTARENHGPLVNALRLGCDPNRPEVKRAAPEYVRKALDEHGALWDGAMAVALLSGWTEGDEPRKSLQAYADAPVPPPGQWDPWTHCTALQTLSLGRDLVDVEDAVQRWMKVVDEGVDEVACWNKMDVWDLLDSISRVDDPRARGIIERYVPVLLRTQGPDGGWGGKSPQIFRALAGHGLLDELRDQPPLPPEWRVVRTVPAPKGKLQTLTWDGSRFWVLDTEAKQAIAVSPEDGRELTRLDLDIESPSGLGWYDGLLVVTTGGFLEAADPARVVLIDADRDRVVKELPFTNDIWYPAGAVQVGRLLWTSQYCWVTTMDVATGQCKGRAYRGAWPLDLAYDGQALWSTDALVPGLYRFDQQANLLDFAEMPFFESISVFAEDKDAWPVTGIAHTDEGLWVLSPSTGQIALIERTGSAFAAAAPTGRTVADLAATVQREGSKVWIDGVPGGTFGTGWDMLARAMQTLLTYRGEKADLDELLAYSGDAFNLCHGSHWQGVSYLCAPTDIVGNMAAAYGYEYEAIHNGYPFETMDNLDRAARVEITERAVDRIQAEIDAGRPPLVGGAEGHCGSWTLAVGYDREGPLLCHVGDHEPYRWTPIRGVAAGSADEDFGHWNGRFRGTIRDGFVGGWQDNPAYLIKQTMARTPTRRENVLASLARAVELHRAPTHHIDWSGGVDYHFGRRAYEQWAAELHKLDFPADLDKPQPDDAYDWYSMGNMDIQADQIVRGRSAARAFCERAAEVFPEAKDHLLAAAWAYREETTIVVKMFGVFLTGSEAEREAWLSDEAKREAGVTAIGQMLEKEQLAVGHIEAALAIVSAAGPGPPIAVGGQPMQAVQPTPVFDIPKLADMDASASPEQWGNRGFRVDVMTPFGPRMPTSQFGARFRLGWDDTGLWLLATVTDDEFHSAESIEKLWANEADLILLYVIREKGEFARILIEPGMTADQPSPRTITDGGGNSLGVRVTRETIDGGYVLQAWAPWSEVGFEPTEGKELRAQVIVLDVDGAGEDIQMGGALWYPAIGTQGNTSISHRLRLADQPSAPQVAVVEASDDRITITAAPQQAGKTVTVVEGERTLVEMTLTIDESTGYAVAVIPQPLPPLSSPIAQPVVMLDGRAIASLNPLQLYLDNYAIRGHNNDTLSMSLVAAAKALGRDADFEAVVCLSSNAFAPMLDTGETCTAWWMCQAWQANRCIETVAGRLGLNIRRIELPEAEGTWDDADAMAAYRRQIAPILREVMAGGEIIVTTGGWEAWQDSGLVPWCWAGIITEARDDGTILGAFVNGRTDNIIYHPNAMYATSAAEPTLAAHEADLIMLQQAINRIRATERFESDELSRYGLAAMDVWIEQMRTVPYCDPCQESNPDDGPVGCAYSSASPVYSGAQFASGYLRRRIGTFTVEARPHIEAAARHYDRIYLLLHPAMSGQGGRSYSQIIPNRQLQNAHADEVLVPVRAQLAAAANAMERALAVEGVVVITTESPSAATALPDYDKLELEGDHHAKDSFSLTMQAVARLYDIDADYGTLYALSTNGFAPDIYPDEPCRSFWRMHGRGQCLDLVAAYLGLDVRPIDPATPETIRQTLAAGAAVIMDRGWEPDVYCWWGIVLEVDGDDSLPIIRRMRGATQNGRTDNPVDHIGRCWAVTRGTPALTQDQADTIMLRRALSRIRGDAPPFVTGRLIFGLSAMDLWIAQMEKPDFQEDDPASSAGNARLCALYSCQGAKDTATYLRERMDGFPGAARPHVASIAARYERIAELLGPFTVWEDGEGYQAFMGDVAKQKAHAEEVLRPVKAEMAAAAEDIEGALTAMSASVSVIPEDDPVAALTEEFTAEQLVKLAAWSNLYGNLEVVLREAATNPELLGLFRQELALGSISPEAATIRGYIGRLEPAEDTYLTHVENILQAIAAGDWGDREQPFFMPGREERLAELRGIMADWVDGVSEVDALSAHDDDATVERIYALLGERTDAKAEAVTGLVGKFSPDGDCDDVFYEWEALAEKTTVAQKMAHHITMLDKPLWHLEYSLSVTLAGIGHGESIGDWRTPGGHLGWKNWINPKDLPRVKTIAKALEVWLAGGEAEGDVAEIVAALGERDAYREKTWLAGCLLHYLRTDGERTDEFVEQLQSDWLPLAPEGFTMDELTDSLVTGDISWYWPRPAE